MVRKISFNRNKGGQASTVSCLAIITRLAELYPDKKFLAVDMDMQGNLSDTLGYPPEDEKNFKSSVVQLLLGQQKVQEVIKHVRPNIDLIPSNLNLTDIGVSLNQIKPIGKEYILKEALAEVENDYSMIVFDNCPSVGIVPLLSIMASNEIMIPIESGSMYSLKGTTQLLSTFQEIQKYLTNGNTKVTGAFITKYERAGIDKNVEEAVRKFFGDIMFKTKIRKNVAIKEALFSGKSIFEYDKPHTTNGSKDYISLVDEIIARGGIE